MRTIAHSRSSCPSRPDPRPVSDHRVTSRSGGGRTSPVLLNAVPYPSHLASWYRLKMQALSREMAVEALGIVRTYVTPSAVRSADQPFLPAVASAAGGVALDASTDEVRRMLIDWGVRWERRFDEMSVEVARLFARKSRRHVDAIFRRMLRRAGFTVSFAPTPRVMATHMATVAEQVGLIRSIPRKFHASVERAVTRAVVRGGDRDELSRVVKRRYGITYRRASLIARDQTAKARAVMENERRLEVGVVRAAWRHSHAGRTPRPEHVRWGRERKTFELAKGMWSERDRKWVLPGTPINCRCYSMAQIPESMVRARDAKNQRRGIVNGVYTPPR